MIFSQSLVAFVAAFGLFVDAAPVWNPVATTSKGQISGAQGSAVTRYTMPYAQAPVGSLRFSRPEALSHFNGTGTYDGTQQPKACLQNDPTGTREQSEDCLYMNIFKPNNIDWDQKLPVLVWVHGGSFTSGGIAEIDASKLAAAQKMIVVTVQYRLGMFGWLKYGRHGIQGNNGLRDVIMSLDVVKKDISAFGGDPSRVTLAGQSSGAQMVNALLSTPSASSLFQRAIVQSAPLDYAPQTSAVAESVGKTLVSDILGVPSRFKINGKASEELLEGQNNLVLAAAFNQLPGVPQSEPFNILRDDGLVSGDGNTIVNTGKQVLYTTVRDEGCAAVYTGAAVAGALGISPDDYESLVGYSFPSRSQAILDSKVYDASYDGLVQLTTDFAWTCPTQRNALSAAGGSTVYLGEFDLGIPAPTTENIPLCNGKVGHEDDISVVFNTPSNAVSPAQANLVKEVQARWGAFARTGNPNPASGFSQWPALTASGELQVLQLGNGSNGESSIATAQRTEGCSLYASL